MSTSSLKPPTAAIAGGALGQALSAGANAGGGWAYYMGKLSRLEPTSWALLAESARGASAAEMAPHAAFLARAQTSTGWLVEGPDWPVNIGFNALVLFTWFAVPGLASPEAQQRLLATLVQSKGMQVAPDPNTGLDGSLQGWSWIDGTFSWVEPTSWGLLALKKARRAGVTSDQAQARIAEGERVLFDRMCHPGGWNFGNASVMGQDLRPYVPTTALALLALQDRQSDPAVGRSLGFLETHWQDEISAPSLGLSLACLRAYGRPTDAIEARLADHAADALTFGNFHGTAVAVFALSESGPTHAFAI